MIKGWELCNVKCGFELLRFEMNLLIDATRFILKESRVSHLLLGGVMLLILRNAKGKILRCYSFFYTFGVPSCSKYIH